jgi:hypothetical protein
MINRWGGKILKGTHKKKERNVKSAKKKKCLKA